MQNALFPLPSDLPTFEAAIQRLEHVPTTLWHALEHAAFKTSSFTQAESPKQKLDAGLSATLFRHHAIDYLKGNDIQAQSDSWLLSRLPFLGISFYYNDFHVRVLKGKSGVLPGCGVSKKRRQFYNQIASMYLHGTQPKKTIANLIILWDFNEMYSLESLCLALPAKGAIRAKDVTVFWLAELPHPGEAQLVKNAPSNTPNDGLGGIVELIDEASQPFQGPAKVNER